MIMNLSFLGSVYVAFQVSFLKNNISDHHLNMVYRLSLIPPSFRGNQLKKYLAFMYLQTVAETVFVSPTHVDVLDVIEIPGLCEQLSPAFKILVKAKNYEVLTSVVEFYDIIIGKDFRFRFEVRSFTWFTITEFGVSRTVEPEPVSLKNRS